MMTCSRRVVAAALALAAMASPAEQLASMGCRRRAERRWHSTLLRCPAQPHTIRRGFGSWLLFVSSSQYNTSESCKLQVLEPLVLLWEVNRTQLPDPLSLCNEPSFGSCPQEQLLARMEAGSGSGPFQQPAGILSPPASFLMHLPSGPSSLAHDSASPQQRSEPDLS